MFPFYTPPLKTSENLMFSGIFRKGNIALKWVDKKRYIFNPFSANPTTWSNTLNPSTVADKLFERV